MTGRTSGFIRLVMGLLVGLALVTSCGGDSAPQAEVGELGMTLSTTNGEVTYRLRDALFQIRGPENRDVCSEDYGTIDDELIFVGLRSGDYQVAMDLGGGGGAGGMAGTPGTGGMGGAGGSNCPNWYMEYSARNRPYERIDAVLVSANPVNARINTDDITYVYFQFEVDGRLIDFGPGTLAIGIDVTETGLPECEVDVDCLQGEVCVDNECVPEVECAIDEQCISGQVCVNNECVPAPPECQDDGDCIGSEICVSNECVPGGP